MGGQETRPLRPGPAMAQVFTGRGEVCSVGRAIPAQGTGKQGWLGTQTTAQLGSFLVDAGWDRRGWTLLLSQGRSSRPGGTVCPRGSAPSFSSIREKSTGIGAGVQGSPPTCRRAWGFSVSPTVSMDTREAG